MIDKLRLPKHPRTVRSAQELAHEVFLLQTEHINQLNKMIDQLNGVAVKVEKRKKEVKNDKEERSSKAK